MLRAALFTVTKIEKQPKSPSEDEWVKKMWCIHTHTVEYSSAIEKNEMMPFVATWMGLEGIILSEISRTDKYCMESSICGF